MDYMKIAFFEIEPSEENYLKDKFIGHQVDFYTNRIDKNNLPNKTDYEIISVFTDCAISQEVINYFPHLKFITTRSTGFNHIDLLETKAKNILVSNVPSYGEDTVAEFTFALMLSISRKIFQSFDRIKESGSFELDGLQGIDLNGKTLGVVGTGRIGKKVIKIAKGFDMKVVAFDAHQSTELISDYAIQYLSFEELLQQSDIITFHVPESPNTFHMINMDNIHLIKRGAIIINTARGSVIETKALIKALNEKLISGAGLDVLEEEVSTKKDNELLIQDNIKGVNLETVLRNHILVDMDNVIITPHNAFNTKEALIRILETTISNINTFIIGEVQNEVHA